MWNVTPLNDVMAAMRAMLLSSYYDTTDRGRLQYQFERSSCPQRKPIAHVDLVSLLRQLYAQVEDEALRGELGDALVLDADKLRQTITIDLDAASIPDDQASGRVCFGCLQRRVDATKHHWDPRDVDLGGTGCVGSVRGV